MASTWTAMTMAWQRMDTDDNALATRDDNLVGPRTAGAVSWAARLARVLTYKAARPAGAAERTEDAAYRGG